jgi:autotransporter-associated beta strand protein
MLARFLLAACALAALSLAARAGDLAVTSDADAGPGTLRAALGAAASGDRIVLSLPDGDHTIALAADPPKPSGTVTIDFGDGPGTVTISGSALTVARGLTLALGPRRHGILEIVMAGDGGVTLAGGGTLVLARAAIYRGSTTIEAGTLRLAQGGSLPPATRLVLDGGVFALGDADARVGGLAGKGGEIVLGERTLTVDQDGDSSFAGPISGKGRLVKDGEGRLSLEAPQAWTGGTMIAGGVLELASGGGLRLSGPIQVKGGALIAPGVTIGSGRR